MVQLLKHIACEHENTQYLRYIRQNYYKLQFCSFETCMCMMSYAFQEVSKGGVLLVQKYIEYIKKVI